MTQRDVHDLLYGGRTIDAVFALASSAQTHRGLYVDVTRAREDITVANGKDRSRTWATSWFAQGNNGKMLVLNINLRVERQQGKQRWRASALTYKS